MIFLLFTSFLICLFFHPEMHLILIIKTLFMLLSFSNNRKILFLNIFCIYIELFYYMFYDYIYTDPYFLIITYGYIYIIFFTYIVYITKFIPKKYCNDECSICLENIHGYVYDIDCHHNFHTHCLDEWIKNKTCCPLCRTILL